LQENLPRFVELNAQVLGISVDSVHSHRHFAEKLDGLDFPLLADFHPKGAVAKAYGLWNEEGGTSRRAVIIIDAEGIVRSVELIPKGPPDVEQVLEAVRALT
jgi:peroxiredoxin